MRALAGPAAGGGEGGEEGEAKSDGAQAAGRRPAPWGAARLGAHSLRDPMRGRRSGLPAAARP